MKTGLIEKYFADFTRDDEELYVRDIPNAAATEWAENNIPLFACSRREL